jgi:hypothetical protein
MSTRGNKRVSSRRTPTKKVAATKAGRTKNQRSKPAATSTTKPDQMSEDELEFITAIDEYKRTTGRNFPSWSEVLEVLKGLGYDRRSA